MDLPDLPSHCPTIQLLLKLWVELKCRLGLIGFLPCTPIWHNKSYKELVKLGNYSTWIAARVKYLSQLFVGQEVKSFNQLCIEFPLLWNKYYMYVQLRHALRVQGRHSTLQIEDSTFLNDIFSTSNKKRIISRIYAFLLSYVQAPDVLPFKEKW